jgi:hypothetical protein
MFKGSHIKDFAEQNPELMSTIPEFKQIYEEVKEKETASKIIWAAYFVAVLVDKRNPFKNTKNDGLRRELLQTEYCVEYSKEYYYLEDLCKNLCLTKEQKLYNVHLRKYEEFTNYLDKLDLSKQADLDKYVSYSSKLEKIDKILEKYRQSFEEKQTKEGDKWGSSKMNKSEERRRDRLKKSQ